jgi:peptide/nickel transport system permease protein
MFSIRRHLRPSLIAGSLIVLAFVAVALAAPLIAPPGDTETPYQIPRYGVSPLPQPPDAAHPLGRLSKQYDIFYGLVWGTRVALQAGLIVTAGRLVIGVVLGLLAGYVGGWTDRLLMRITDAFLSFPIMAAGMVMVAIFGREIQRSFRGGFYLTPHGEEQVLIAALVLFGWMSYARLVRGNVLAEREREYVQAARATGVGHLRLLARHLWPNVRQGLFVLAASDVGAAVVLLATFAFVGLIHPPYGHMEADWGQMLNAARDWIIGSPADAFAYWYTYLPVSAAIILFSVGWNLVGDGLREAFDPRLR